MKEKQVNKTKVRAKRKKTTKSLADNTLSVYLNEINKIPLLTREQEIDLATRIREGDEIAKEKLIRANLRFVVNVAKKYQNQGLSLMDLISEGNIGLINAIEKFDVDKGYHFISYAVWWIRQAILKAICEKSRMIRLPLNRANELMQIEKAKKELTIDNGEEPEVGKIAKSLDMKTSHVKDLVNISKEIVSLETPIYDNSDSTNLGGFIEDSKYESPDEYVLKESLLETINQVLSTLTKKESEIVQYRFGLNGRRPLSLKEIGEKYNLTKERIRQIEKNALKRLRHSSRSQLLKAFIAAH
jgi:RNA polymerase primary sigma factor